MIQQRHRFGILLRRQICLNSVWRVGCEGERSESDRVSASEAEDRSLTTNLATPRRAKPAGLIESYSVMGDHHHHYGTGISNCG